MDRLGTATVRRASHVEPDAAGNWIADLSPVRGPVCPPHRNRADALRAEIEWLERNLGNLPAAS